MIAGADMRDVAHLEITRNLDKRVMRALPLPRRELVQYRSASSAYILHLAADTLMAVRMQSLWRARKAQRMLHQIVSQVAEQRRSAKQQQTLEDEQKRCIDSESSKHTTVAGEPAVATQAMFISEEEQTAQDLYSIESPISKGTPLTTPRSDLASVPPLPVSPAPARLSEAFSTWGCAMVPCASACLMAEELAAPCTAIGRHASPVTSPREFTVGIDESRDLLVMIDPFVRGDEEAAVARERSSDGTDEAPPSSPNCRLPEAATLVKDPKKDAKRSLLKCAL